MNSTVTIASRFAGPPGSANGGYTCGLIAEGLDGGPIEVTLRRPPPLERPLDLVRAAGRAELYDGDQLVAEARPAELPVEPPPPIPFEVAEDAARHFDVADYARRHPYPGCFVCGPEREPGDGLRVFPAAGPNCVVWPWIPDASHTGDDGLVRRVLMWAVLDCPSGMTWIHEHPDHSPHVLGRLTAEVRRRPAAGERVVVAGWPIGEEGRKRLTGSVVWAAGGEVVARALATWIALDERQRAIFRPAGETG